jgi:disulfide bond formation protein DsbB
MQMQSKKERKDMKRILAILAVMALVLAACGGSGDDGGSSDSGDSGGSSGNAAAGEDIYDTTCVACHAADATGIEGLGKDLTNSDFINGLSDDELVAFLKVGRSASDPDNTTGVEMPVRGGNPSLSDDDLNDVAAFLRTLPGN